MNLPSDLPRYDASQTYDWNYQHAPEPFNVEVPEVPGDWQFCGLPVASPLGMPAGPLLNGRWLLYYASLGFDVLVYKTVRSRRRECYPLPNLQPVQCEQLQGGEQQLSVSPQMQGSWAVSFGMPSQPPEVWQADIAAVRRGLAAGKVLVVSVVGTVDEGAGLDQLADDYADCARRAVEAGAHAVETNFSCPNVTTCDGQLYQVPGDAAVVAARVRRAIGPDVPYLIKIGHQNDATAAGELLAAVGDQINGLAMTNSVATTVIDDQGRLLFDGQRRGICGDAVRSASLAQMRMFRELIERQGRDIQLMGVGGANSAAHVREYLAAGAQSVHLGTAAMIDPGIALKIRAELQGATVT